MKRRRCGLF